MDNLQVKTNSADRLWSFFGGPVARRMARWRMLFEEVEEFERQFNDLTDGQLKKESLSLRFRAKSGEKLDRLISAAAALVRAGREHAAEGRRRALARAAPAARRRPL